MSIRHFFVYSICVMIVMAAAGSLSAAEAQDTVANTPVEDSQEVVTSEDVEGSLQGTIPSTDDVPIAYTVRGEGSPALVFVHGWVCDQSYWDAQATYFAEKYTVVTLDLAGHGQSGLDRKEWTIEAFADDVIAVINALELSQVVLIGHSMGGSIILDVAGRIPERIVGVIGVDTFQNVELKTQIENIEQILAPLREDFKGYVSNYIPRLFPKSADPELVSRVAEEMASSPVDVGVGGMKAAMMYSLAPAAEKVQVPIRAINSDKFPTDLEANRRHMKSFEVVLMPGFGHFLYLEAPEQFNTYLDLVLQELLGKTEPSEPETTQE